MQRLIASATILLLAAAVLLAAPATRATDDPTALFVTSAIKNIGAQSVRCPKAVRTAVRSRQMIAVCASFDGDFELFRERWAQRMELDPPEGHTRNPLPQARTSWENRDGTYERIYAVGESAVGIRFRSGELMLVYAE